MIKNIKISLITILSLGLIVINNFFLNTGYFDLPMAGKKMFFFLNFQVISMIGIPLVLIALGYVMVEKEMNLKYWKNILYVSVIYLVTSLIYYFSVSSLFSFKSICNQLLSFSINSNTWFVEIILVILVFSPLINQMFDVLEDNKKRLLIILLTTITAIPLFVNVNNNYIFNYWIILYPLNYYLIGSYIKKSEFKVKVLPSILYICLSYVFVLVFIYFVFNGSYYSGLSYGSLPIVLLTTSVFLYINNINEDKVCSLFSKFLNSLSKLVPCSYLFISFIGYFIYPIINNKYSTPSVNIIAFIIGVGSIVVGSLMLSFVINFIYDFMEKIFFNNKKVFSALCTLLVCISVVSISVYSLYINAATAFIYAQPRVLQYELDLLDEQQLLYEGYLLEFVNGEYDYTNPYVVVNPYDLNSLSALVLFETSEATKVTYTVLGDILFEQTIADYKTVHEIPIIMLYPGIDNEVLIELEYQDGSTAVETIVVTTDNIPSDVFNIDIEVVSYQSDLDDYFIQCGSTGNAIGYNFIMDTNGVVRLFIQEEFNFETLFTDDSTILCSQRGLAGAGYASGYSKSIFEMDYLGKIINTYKIPFEAHHDYIILPNGNLLVATSDQSYHKEDTVIEIDRQTGEIVFEWDFKDYLDEDRLTIMASSENIADWFHINSVEYSEEYNELIVSGRRQNTVVAIDISTNELKWILGEQSDYKEEYYEYSLQPEDEDLEYFYAQHDAKIDSNGDITLFDNGYGRLDENGERVVDEELYSRAVVYSIDRDNMTFKEECSYTASNEYYAFYLSGVQELNDDSLLINFGGIIPGLGTEEEVQSAYVVEVDSNNNILREINISDGNLFRAKQITFVDELIVDTKVGELLYDDEFYNSALLENYDLTHGIRLFGYIDELNISNKVAFKYTITNNDTNESKSGIYYESRANDNHETYIVIDTFGLAEGDYTISFDLLKCVNDEYVVFKKNVYMIDGFIQK